MTEEQLSTRLDRAQGDLQDAYADLGAPRAGDEELLARLVDRAVDTFPVPLGVGPTAAGGLKPWLVGALVVGVVGGAVLLSRSSGRSEGERHVTAVGQAIRGERIDLGPAMTLDSVSRPDRESRRIPAPIEHESVRSAPTTPGPTGMSSGPIAPSTHTAPKGRKRRIPTSVAAAKPSAAELLIAANRNRRADELERARADYALLVRDYAETREAAVARFNLGVLARQRSDAAAAVRHFDGYLHHAPRGNLAEDAMYYRAQAFQDLDKHASEGAAWKMLLDRFPDSAYQERAHRRLDALADP